MLTSLKIPNPTDCHSESEVLLASLLVLASLVILTLAAFLLSFLSASLLLAPSPFFLVSLSEEPGVF